jgi:serine/threonine-protein kinase RsbW
MKSSLQIRGDLPELNTVHTHLHDLDRNWRLGRKTCIEINLILDELITNIIEHGAREKEHLIDIILTKTGRNLTIEVQDDGPLFDPTVCPLPDTSLGLDKRKCGGLGILLVRRLSDSCRYRREKNKNVLTLQKTLPEECR